MNKRVVVVVVRGGVADVHAKPPGVVVEIVDYDNLDAGEGTGDEFCPCQIGPEPCAICAGPTAGQP